MKMGVAEGFRHKISARVYDFGGFGFDAFGDFNDFSLINGNVHKAFPFSKLSISDQKFHKNLLFIPNSGIKIIIFRHQRQFSDGVQLFRRKGALRRLPKAPRKEFF